jgi:hypothetical protein
MKIVPTRMEEQINRVDRTTSLGIGIASGITALCCVYRLIWLLYAAVTFSSVGWSPISLVFPFVLWGMIGVVAAIGAVGLLTRYAKGPEARGQARGATGAGGATGTAGGPGGTGADCRCGVGPVLPTAGPGGATGARAAESGRGAGGVCGDGGAPTAGGCAPVSAAQLA